MAASNRGTGYWVESSDGSTEYWVVLDPRGYRGDRCTCPDYERRGGPRKHAIAVRLLQKCEAVEQGPAPPPIPFPVERYDLATRFELTPLGLAALDLPPG